MVYCRTLRVTEWDKKSSWREITCKSRRERHLFQPECSFDGLQTITLDRNTVAQVRIHDQRRDTAERKCRRMHQRKHASTF